MSLHLRAPQLCKSLGDSLFTPCLVSSRFGTMNVNKDARYFMPAESGLHSCTLMGFPSLASAVDDKKWLKGMRSEVTAIANAISKFEPVRLYSREEDLEEAQRMVDSNVTVKPAIIDQLWMRDTGPIFVKDQMHGALATVDFKFNYWGKKLPPTGDETMARQVTEDFAIDGVQACITAEGGGIEIDGEGTFLGAESSFINDNRNPGKSKQDIEDELRRTLGVDKFLWVKGIKGDEITDAHIDAAARFIEPGVVVLSEPAETVTGLWRDAFEEAKDVLSKSTDSRGRKLELHICREANPDVVLGGDETEAAISYVNYSLVNGGIVIPKFGDKAADGKAFKLFQRLFPGRKVVQVHLNILPRTGGGVHCATQHVPVVEPKASF